MPKEPLRSVGADLLGAARELLDYVKRFITQLQQTTDTHYYMQDFGPKGQTDGISIPDWVGAVFSREPVSTSSFVDPCVVVLPLVSKYHTHPPLSFLLLRLDGRLTGEGTKRAVQTVLAGEDAGVEVHPVRVERSLVETDSKALAEDLSGIIREQLGLAGTRRGQV